LVAYGHEVEIFWDEAWTGGEPVPWQRVADYDVVVMFQSVCQTGRRTFAQLHPNVVYVPMFDQFGLSLHAADLSTFWQPFRGCNVVSFSAALHALATGAGIVSHFVRYYPEVPPEPAHAQSGLHGFFWLRRETELGWGLVRTLVGSTQFDTFHLHVAGD